LKLAFALFKYFPYGGLQKDLWRIAHACAELGHQVEIYCGVWQGEKPAQIPVIELGKKGWSNHARNRRFSQDFAAAIKGQGFDRIVGFDRLPGLDWYYAADSCFKAKKISPWYALTARARHFLAVEQAVFGRQSATQLLMISKAEMASYQRCYQTQEQRFHLLPPGISPDRVAPSNAHELTKKKRLQLKVGDEQKLLLMVGSGFKTKGVDRSIRALAALPENKRARVFLKIAGQDNPKRFIALAKALGVEQQVEFLGGRDDVPELLLAADLLIHPAYRENTGTVLLEAMVAGTPVLVSDVCGYAHYVSDFAMGQVVGSPLLLSDLAAKLDALLFGNNSDWAERGCLFAERADIYAMPQRAAELITGAIK
jgi:UDP-glucose:(heptosyl)LPS alpha-1,3-glucosyltransferase